ncbi:MAG: hypothetical protein VX872_10760, partial [Candidatus Thermoplasmatota archaeon]|nr:hypothetical protein [Candidatus Thermoplasmatota archaeon]
VELASNSNQKTRQPLFLQWSSVTMMPSEMPKKGGRWTAGENTCGEEAWLSDPDWVFEDAPFLTTIHCTQQ